MLAVGVHHQRVREALRGGGLDAVQHRRALALVLGQDQHAQAGIVARLLLQPLHAVVGTAIHDYPDR